jgi:hypothetical protein
LTRVKNTFNWNKIQLHHHAEIFSKLSRMTWAMYFISVHNHGLFVGLSRVTVHRNCQNIFEPNWPCLFFQDYAAWWIHWNGQFRGALYRIARFVMIWSKHRPAVSYGWEEKASFMNQLHLVCGLILLLYWLLFNVKFLKISLRYLQRRKSIQRGPLLMIRNKQATIHQTIRWW